MVGGDNSLECYILSWAAALEWMDPFKDVVWINWHGRKPVRSDAREVT
jgi:hypothetical protein